MTVRPEFAPELRWRPFPGFTAGFLSVDKSVVRDIARRYLASRRECVDRFVDRHFSLIGALRLHRQAIGWDLLRVPANLLLSPATLAVSLASRIAARLGLARTAAWLDRYRPFFVTAVAREGRDAKVTAPSYASSQRPLRGSVSCRTPAPR